MVESSGVTKNIGKLDFLGVSQIPGETLSGLSTFYQYISGQLKKLGKLIIGGRPKTWENSFLGLPVIYWYTSGCPAQGARAGVVSCLLIKKDKKNVKIRLLGCQTSLKFPEVFRFGIDVCF